MLEMSHVILPWLVGEASRLSRTSLATDAHRKLYNAYKSLKKSMQ